MRVIVFGTEQNLKEVKKKLPESAAVDFAATPGELSAGLLEAALILDFRSPSDPAQLAIYTHVDRDALILINTLHTGLNGLSGVSELPKIGGFNGWPGFIDRPVWEVTSLHGDIFSVLEKAGINYRQVEDRVGMVTPRIIGMIINEAYYTVQEGTASRTDIDHAMKLGTAYPFGPFEWCEKIGVKEVYSLLSAVYEDTRDPRYKICPLLKREATG